MSWVLIAIFQMKKDILGRRVKKMQKTQKPKGMMTIRKQGGLLVKA